jgi:isocitrate dehydrogenase
MEEIDNIGDSILMDLPDIMQLSTRIIDDDKWICASIFDEIPKDVWKNIKSIMESKFLLIYEKKVKYHFVFDIHAIPMKRLPSFMKLMTKYQHVLDECLLSTAIVTHNKFLHSAMKLALELYTPVRPIQFFYKENADTSPSEEYSMIPMIVMGKVKEYFRETHEYHKY